MPPPEKKRKMETMQCTKNPVSFEQFKKLIENLCDICFEVQRDGVAGEGVKTLDECAFWYYKSFYRDPEVRNKYPCKLRACPKRIRDKLLELPESQSVGDPVTEHQNGVLVKVAKMGQFLFPVTFFVFKSLVNTEKVLRMMGMTKEERQTMLADEEQCEIILKKFYNSFYMFPDRKSSDIFENISSQLLVQVLKHGEPCDQLAKESVEKYHAEKRQPVVSFEVFEKFLGNMYDIVWQMKLHDSQYVALDFEKCARALYLSFYLKPEIRDKYTFKWRSCSLAMQKRLLHIPNEESVEELRKLLPQLVPESPNEEEVEVIDVDSYSPMQATNKSISVADDLRKSLDSAPKKREHPTSSEEIPKLVTESSKDLEEELFQTDVELDIDKAGRFMFPVSFDTFRRCINYAEIIRTILMLAIQDESQLADLIPHPQNPICEKIFRRFYRSFYVFPDSRQRCRYSFSCPDSHVLKKLEEYAIPLNESAIKTMNKHKTGCQDATKTVCTDQDRNNLAEEAGAATVLAQGDQCEMETIEKVKDKEIREYTDKGPRGNAKKLPKLPVTFTVFRRYVRNFNEIVQQMKLCDEFKEKSDTECAEEYYKRFYTSSEMRNKFECKLKPCPAKIREALLSYAQHSESEDSVQESGDVCVEDVMALAPTETILSESKDIPAEESKAKKVHENPVSFKHFQRYVSNLKEIVQKMLLCDEHRGKSEEECARDYYNGFYSSQEMRDMFPYQLKACPAKVRSKLISFPTKDQNMDDASPEKQSKLCDPICSSSKKLRENILVTETDQVEVHSSEIPVLTEGSLADNQTSQHFQQTSATHDQKSGKTSQKTIITLQNGGSFEFPVSFKTFKRHINYDEIVKSLLREQDKSDTEQSNEGKRLFNKFYCSFYIQKNVRQSYPYRFHTADKELLKKLEEYAVPLDDMARETLSAQNGGNEDESRMVPCAPKDETLINVFGVAYRFPVSFNTFRNYINYEELKVGLAHGPSQEKKSPEELAEILGDETKCLRLLRSYYRSFYTKKNIRNKLKYNFNAAPPELSDKLLEWAKPIDEATEPAQTQPHIQTKDGVPSATDHVQAGRQQEAQSQLSKNACHFNNRDPDETDATKEAELARPHNLQQYIARHFSSPEKQAVLERHILDAINANKSTSEISSDPLEAETSEAHLIEGAPQRKASDETNEAPPVTINSKQVIESNSLKENEPQKSSELASDSENSISSKEIHTEYATNKPPEMANRSESHLDSTNNPESSSGRPSPDHPCAKSYESKAASNSSLHQSERQIVLDQAKKEFFAESSKEHNMPYLICTSQGLKRAIWRILYQLTMEEFKTFTSIHNGEDLYRNGRDLEPYYQHVVDKGNWPLNLYVKLPLLRQLLYSKGVHLGRLNLGQLSPKMLHWRAAEEHTNFDQIVEMQFKDRTGKEIDNLMEFFEERERLYAACWHHDRWIYEVPQILSEALNDESCMKDLPLPDLNGIVLKSLPIVQSEAGTSQTEIISIASSSDMVADSQSCPPTQLSNTSVFVDNASVDVHSSSAQHDESSINTLPVPNSNETVLDSQSCPPTQLRNNSTFVDIASVNIHSQIPEAPHDPLATISEALATVKREPIIFLNNLRGICDTDNCQWERIGSEEQIMNLDSSQEEGPSLSCFAIQKPSDVISPYQSLDSLLTATMFEGEDDVSLRMESDKEHPEEPDVPPEPSPAVPKDNVIQSKVLLLPNPLVNLKKKLPASDAVPSKRIRLVNDKVPQLRHEFRPLPLGACISIETTNLREEEPTEPPRISPMPPPEVVPNTITPSQEFAQGNSLLESSQLAPLVDTIPPGVTVRKVIENEQLCKNSVRVIVPKPTLRQRAIFRRLERFHFFAPLTAQQIIQHRIEGYMVGASYQSAILKIDGKVSQVRGSLLNILFPHISPPLLSDLERVLGNLREFVYNCRWRRVQTDTTVDLRIRILFTFIEMAPEFGPFLLHFESASREWATCTEIDSGVVTQNTEPRPRNFENVISPGILERMREFKAMC